MVASQVTLPDTPSLSAPRRVGLVESGLPWLFLVYALPMVLFLSLAMAPLQVADELAHFKRADQIGRGRLVAESLGPQNTGGIVDGGIVALGDLYHGMWFHREVKQTEALARQAGAIAWSRHEATSFGNTGIYGPVLYLPQVIGIWLGQAARLGVAQTLIVARLINGLTACLVGFLALSLCRRGRALMFATLLLPMTLSQLGSASQDALIITLSLLALAIVSRVIAERRPAGTGEFALFAVIVMATTLARTSQIGLVLLAPGLVGGRDAGWPRKAVIAALAAVPVVYWMFVVDRLMPAWHTGVSVPGQFAYLFAHPLALPAAMATSAALHGGFILKGVVGLMGWNDTPMPRWYYAAAGVALAFALIAPGNRGALLRPALLAVATIVVFTTAVCGALYLTWTPVGAPYIELIQGRYLLPILPLLAWMIPGARGRVGRALALAWYPVLLFPLVTLAAMPGVIVERYYGSWSVLADSLRALLLP